MYLQKLILKNFQVIDSFESDFKGSVYLVNGDNEVGKSTILKSIGILLTGNRDDVLQKGKTKGFAKAIIGKDGEEYEVKLSFTEANPRGTLTITGKDGMKSSNISTLQSIFGYTDFDAVEFSSWSNTADGRRKQVDVIKSMLPNNVIERLSEIDNLVEKKKDERKDLNKEIKSLQTILSSSKSKLPANKSDYLEPLDLDALAKESEVFLKAKNNYEKAKEQKEVRTNQIADIPNRVQSLDKSLELDLKEVEKKYQSEKEEVERIMKQAQERLAKAEFEKDNSVISINVSYKEKKEEIEKEEIIFKEKLNNCIKFIEQYKGANIQDPSDKLKKANEYTNLHLLVKEYDNKALELDSKSKELEEMESNIKALIDEKGELITSSKLPISGLTFTDDGLELNGIPFTAGKVSDSQIMEVAVKLVIAMNKNVSVFKIARGESLGEKRLKEIIKIAQENGFQGFIEEVHRGQEELKITEYTEE